jgi:hypothetical protein
MRAITQRRSELSNIGLRGDFLSGAERSRATESDEQPAVDLYQAHDRVCFHMASLGKSHEIIPMRGKKIQSDGTKLLMSQAIERGFAEFLKETDSTRNQKSVESFAIRATAGGTDKYFGHNELQLILALGGKKPVGFD